MSCAVSLATADDRQDLVSVYNAAFSSKPLFRARYGAVSAVDVQAIQDTLVRQYLGATCGRLWKAELNGKTIAWCWWQRRLPKPDAGAVATPAPSRTPTPTYPAGTDVDLVKEFGRQMRLGSCHCALAREHLCACLNLDTRGDFRSGATLDNADPSAVHISTDLDCLAVDPEYQGQGIAAVLVETGLKDADAAGLDCFLYAADGRRGSLVAANSREIERGHT